MEESSVSGTHTHCGFYGPRYGTHLGEQAVEAGRLALACALPASLAGAHARAGHFNHGPGVGGAGAGEEDTLEAQ